MLILGLSVFDTVKLRGRSFKVQKVLEDLFELKTNKGENIVGGKKVNAMEIRSGTNGGGGGEARRRIRASLQVGLGCSNK